MPQERRRVTVPLLLIFGALAGLSPLATDMYLAAFPQMSRDLAAPASMIQLTLSAFMVGLGVGQLVIGPLSDQIGRRRPLLVGSLVCFLASLGCTLAPTVELLVACRFVMGFSGAAGVVIARSMISDLSEGDETTRFMNYMMMITGVSPVLAPSLGGVVLALGDWRLVFTVITVATAVLALAVFFVVPESLPPAARHSGGVRQVFTGIATMVRRPRYLGFALAGVASFGTLFAYVSGSTYVLQNRLGLSETQYVIAFAVNAAGMLLATALANALLRRFTSAQIVLCAQAVVALSALALLALSVTGVSLVPVLVLLFVCVAGQGLIFGNTSALALDAGRDHAGTSSALMGAAQFAVGGFVSPLVGLGGDEAVLPMALCMAVCALLSLLIFAATHRGTSAPIRMTPAAASR
ncbi:MULTISPECIES: multidrug effflux MFS transporter [Arsenicicoccus]|uniref:multidrug effflux MFS transporter n=1 Tax=Arsenicicoccus TaxID=267408 RepID=UPI0002EF8A67|nr:MULTISPECIES: multidrug effflux MFS transporter [Arsenicicoccus]